MALVASDSGLPDSKDVPTIRDLIRTALDGGATVRGLEKDSGGRVKYQTFQDLSQHPPKQFPKVLRTVQGMAAALKVSETTVVLAYAKGMGMNIDSESGFAMQLPRGVDQLSDEMQRAILAVARAAVRAIQRGEDPAIEVEPLHSPAGTNQANAVDFGGVHGRRRQPPPKPPRKGP